MRIIKLNAIDSTNSYLRGLSEKNKLSSPTVVVAKSQLKGKGQMGNQWDSEPGKNLTFSVFRRFDHLTVEMGFYVSMAVSLALVNQLKRFQIPKLAVKWPNDILSEDKKICGILIENISRRQKIEASIIGIGININQTQFSSLPMASSLKIISGHFFDLDEVLTKVLDELEYWFALLDRRELITMKTGYETLLYRKNKPSTFEASNGERFPAFIEGIDEKGKLRLLLEDDIQKSFDLKEVKLLF